jgi:hypothetical protein
LRLKTLRLKRSGVDELTVGTENDVAVLLHMWTAAKVGDGDGRIDEKQLRQLCERLRVARLTHSFRWYLYEKLSAKSSRFFWPLADRLFRFNVVFVEGGDGVSDKFSSLPVFPAEWSAPARRGSRSIDVAAVYSTDDDDDDDNDDDLIADNRYPEKAATTPLLGKNGT